MKFSEQVLMPVRSTCTEGAFDELSNGIGVIVLTARAQRV